MNLVLLKNISLVGVHWGSYTSKQAVFFFWQTKRNRTSTRARPYSFRLEWLTQVCTYILQVKPALIFYSIVYLRQVGLNP